MNNAAPDTLPPDGELLFAYGTLQRGGDFHYFLERYQATLVGTGRTEASYPLIVLDYPCLVEKPGKGHSVQGELYRIAKSSHWNAIDYLEGHPTEYIRKVIPVKSGERTLMAWTYFYQYPPQPLDNYPFIEAFVPGAGNPGA
jgi:gamma-glutamylcyclotransferase (GGCT)/AIG2-like uncharacterized protein YtfP